MPLTTPLPAWTTFSPTVSAGVGALTTASVVDARYMRIGNLVHVYMEILITTNGTGSSYVASQLPVAGRSRVNLYGREAGVTGKMLLANAGAAVTALTIVDYSNAYPGADGARLVLTGTYEAQ